MNNRRFVILAAGGSGSRFDGNVPKQFLLNAGEPLFAQSLRPFFLSDENISVVISLPENFLEEGKTISEKYFPGKNIRSVVGGSSRTQSVRNALNVIAEQEGIVAVHDAARPFISVELIEKCFTETEKSGSAVPCILPKDSLRIIEDNNSKPLDRNSVRLVQTPQCFRLADLKNAFEKMNGKEFSDEATLMEAAGFKIHLVEGEEKNSKVTFPDDLAV